MLLKFHYYRATVLEIGIFLVKIIFIVRVLLISAVVVLI